MCLAEVYFGEVQEGIFELVRIRDSLPGKVCAFVIVDACDGGRRVFNAAYSSVLARFRETADLRVAAIDGFLVANSPESFLYLIVA